MQEFFTDIANSFVKTFITDNRWLQLLQGLGVTVEITLFAALLGICLGFLIAIIRSTYDMNMLGKKCRKFSDYVLKVINAICNVYITVIRGTPVVIQLMIMYFIIFASSRNGIIPAILAFGINSGAYVAEIVRSGIMSIDKGQFEASRSLGFDYKRTMIYVIIPQAFKNVLPALGNEFIVLVKETSVAGYAAIQDLTYVGNLIRSRTYEAFFPLITVAVIYLVIVLILSYFLKKLERRLRSSDH
ncbi:MAG: amino acid ABC transporter permease [Oscillospiraceae bacterium]|nr:amino acid ABC transporter permease [Oscillospiraceae bacterium]